MIGLRKLMSGRDGRPGAALPDLERFRLGSAIVADPVRHSIVRDGRAIAVEPRVMQLLTYFAARPGQVISKEELREQVWGTNVVDEAVHRAMSLLRSALGDTPRQSTIIETVPRHGYRLLITPAAVEATNGQPLKSRRLRLAAAAAGMAALALLLSPAMRSGPAEAPALPVAASIEAPQVVESDRQQSPRVVALAPRSPEMRPDNGLETPAAAPQAPERRASPGLAPKAPAAPTDRPGEAPALPVAGQLKAAPATS